jgi:predicted dehydrogenase
MMPENSKEGNTMEEQKLWRGGMIGAGAWSSIQLDAWKGVKNARIVALTDRHPDRRDPILKHYHIPEAFDDFEAMLDSSELDFVDICTRPYSHLKLAQLAIKRNLPILCQKPFCDNISDANEIVANCKSAGVRLMINENFRWQAWYRKVRELLYSGALGKPFFAKFHQRLRLLMPKFEHSQKYFTEMPNALFFEVGTHLVDLTRFFFGEPQNIYMRKLTISPDMKGEDVFVAVLGYRDLNVVFHDSWVSVPIPGLDRSRIKDRWLPRLLEIEGTLGTLVLKPDHTLHLYTDTDHQSWKFPADTAASSHILCQQHFIDCLESGKEFETSGADTVNTMRVVWAAYQSAEEARVVQLAE